GDEGTIKVWDTGTGRTLRSLNGRGAPVRSLHWSPDGRRLASAADDGPVQILEAETGREAIRIPHLARQVAWSPDGTEIATAGQDNETRIWSAADGRPIGPVLTSLEPTGIAWAPDGQRLAGFSRYASLWAWEKRSGRVLFTVKQSGQPASM